MFFTDLTSYHFKQSQCSRLPIDSQRLLYKVYKEKLRPELQAHFDRKGTSFAVYLKLKKKILLSHAFIIGPHYKPLKEELFLLIDQFRFIKFQPKTKDLKRASKWYSQCVCLKYIFRRFLRNQKLRNNFFTNFPRTFPAKHWKGHHARLIKRYDGPILPCVCLITRVISSVHVTSCTIWKQRLLKYYSTKISGKKVSGTWNNVIYISWKNLFPTENSVITFLVEMAKRRQLSSRRKRVSLDNDTSIPNFASCYLVCYDRLRSYKS